LRGKKEVSVNEFFSHVKRGTSGTMENRGTKIKEVFRSTIVSFAIP
jgi:hypothetical protein